MPDRNWWLNLKCQDKPEAKAALLLLEQTIPNGNDFRMEWGRNDKVVVTFAMPTGHEILLRLAPQRKCLHVDFAVGPSSGRREQGLRAPLERLQEHGYVIGRKKTAEERYFIDLTAEPLKNHSKAFWAFVKIAGQEKRLHS